jgi:protein-S-isoprenylcysteine O-methyltransferase Ste14
MNNLTARAWVALAVLALVMGPPIFLIAGTVGYWQAWVYLAIFFGASALTTIYVTRNDPALLERRMRGGPTAETRPVQRVIMLFTVLGFVALLVVPALDHRYAWSEVPLFIVLLGEALVVIGFYFIFLVYKENTFASATVQVVAEQQVISTGPYAIVRHPMYASALLYLLGTPLALGSYWGLVPIAAILPFLIWRLFDEERLLREQLAGYSDYQQKVPNRLLPGIW